MGFFNMHTRDAPGFQRLAARYAISDNYHQPIMGGTGANFLALVTGDVAFHNAQPGVAAIRRYLDTLRYRPFNDGNCAPAHYYLVNNYGLGYDAVGNPKPLGPTNFTLPPQVIPTIADALSARGVSWKYYSGGRNNGTPTSEYCGICDPLTGFTSIMTTSLRSNLQDVTDFYRDVAGDHLPAVAFVRPFESQAGHPANSTLKAYEDFVTDLVSRVQSNPSVWAKTAILITVDEGGGYYDSGYIQPIDFFGDGTRIPLIAVSPLAKRGHVDHTYTDHVSILKFIEHNWDLPPLSARSRDNLPNPTVREDNPYVPINSPAIGDLMSLFDFDHAGDDGVASNS